MRRVFGFGFATLFLFANSAIATANRNQSPAHVTSKDAIDQLISKYESPNSPGLAVVVTQNGNTLYKRGVGIANFEYGIPITPTTAFHVGSISKQFTCFSILLLEKEGKLKLDDEVRKYLPELPSYGAKLTLRHLATHTGGLRNETDLLSLTGMHESDSRTNAEVLKMMVRQNSLNFLPGEKFDYSNSGYVLLAEVVARASGKPFDEFVRERILKPLGMNHSAIISDAESIIPNFAYSYHTFNEIRYKTPLNSSCVGSTGLVTTAEDLSRWATNFDSPKVGDLALLKRMEEQGKLNNGTVLPYALGQEKKNYKGLQVIFHGGGIASYTAYLLRIPKENFSVVITSNSGMNPLDLAYGIVDVFLYAKQVPAKPVDSKWTNSPQRLSQLVGEYEVFPGLYGMISTTGNKLFLQFKGDEEKLELPRVGEFTFTYKKYPNSRIEFRNPQAGKSSGFTWHISDFFYTGERVILKPFDASRVNLKEFAGLFYSPELEDGYELVVQNKKLLAKHRRNDDIELTPIQKDVFNSGVGFFRKAEFVRNSKGKVVGVKISAQQSKDVYFALRPIR